MKNRSKVVGISIGVLGLCLMILAVGLLIFVNTDQFRHILLNKINASIAGNLAVGRHDISFIKGRVALQNVTLEAAPGNRLATLEYLRVDIAFLPLLTRTLFIESMTLERPDIQIKMDKNGVVDILEAFKVPSKPQKVQTQQPSSTPFDVIAQDIRITNGACDITLEPDNLHADLEHITLQAKADLLKKTGRIELKIEDTALTYGARHLDINPVTLSVMLPEGRPASVAFKAKTDAAEIALNGDVSQDFHNPSLNLDLTFDVSLSELKNFMPLPAEFSGKTNGVLTVRGPWRDPDADLRLNYSGGALAGYPVDGLRTDLRLKNRQLLVQQLEFLAGAGAVSLAGNVDLQDVLPEGLFSSQVHLDNIRYAMEAGVKHVDVAFLNNTTHGVNGFLTSTVVFKGDGIDLKKLSLSTTMETLLEAFFVEGMQHPIDLKIDASASMEAGVIDSNRITILAAGTRLNARGVFDLSSEHFQGDLTAATENIEKPLSLLGMTGNSGACTINADVSGSLTQADIRFQMNGKNMQFSGLRLGDVDLAANLNPDGLLNITSLKLVNQGTNAQGNGTVQVFEEKFQLHPTMPLEAKLKIAGLKSQHFLDDATVDGSFEGEIRIGGNVRSLQASTVMSGKNVAYAEIPLGDLLAHLRLFDGKLLLDQFQLESETASVDLKGEIQIFEPNSWQPLKDIVLNLDLKGDAVSLEDYLPDITGNLHLDAHLEGPVSRLQGQGSLKGDHLDLMGQPLEKMSLDMELKDNRLHMLSSQAALETDSVVNGSGWIGFDGSYSIDLHTTGLRLNSIARIQEMKIVAGKVDFHLRGDGNVKNPSIFGDLYAREVLVNNQKMDDFDFQINLAQNQLTMKGHQTFELELAYHLLNKDFFIDLLFSDTDITPFFLTTGYNDFGGRLNGKMVAKGNMDALDSSEVSLNFSDMSLTYRGVSFVKTSSLQGNLKDQHLSIPEFDLNVLESGRLKVKGNGTLDGYFDLTADGNIPMEAAIPLLKGVSSLEGNIDIHAEMKGSVSEPDVSAEIVLHDVGCTLPQLDPYFKDINGKLQLTSSQLSIENIIGKFDSGLFQVNGNMALENLRPGRMQLNLNLNEMPIIVPGTMDVFVNADLSASGTMENILIEGDIVMLEGVYYKKVRTSLLESMKEQTRTIEGPSRQRNKLFFNKLAYNIRLKYREPFIVDNDMAYLEIHPDLVLSGTWDAPVITGTAKIHEGTIFFQSKSFVVEKGFVSFSDPYKIAAEVDIVGSMKIRNWQIFLTVRGPPKKLIVELSSTPSEEDADILSLLVFGKTTYEMRSGDVANSDSTQALLAQLAASSFGGDIKKTTGLDYLEVTTREGEEENDPDIVDLTVGKDLTERMALKYTVGSGRGGYHQRASTEYKLVEHILLSGFQDIEGSYGGEIIFRIEFNPF
jgi:translocation and assembly module TamB